MKLTQQQIDIYNGWICPYCKRPSKHVDSSEIYGHNYPGKKMYACLECKAWVGTHESNPDKALGRLAQKNLRDIKISVHYYFDSLWRGEHKTLTRHEAYAWLADILKLPVEYTHIGWFGLETCRRVLEVISPNTFVRPTKLNLPKRTKKHKSTIKKQ